MDNLMMIVAALSFLSVIFFAVKSFIKAHCFGDRDNRNVRDSYVPVVYRKVVFDTDQFGAMHVMCGLLYVWFE